ncbi:MAG TPA: [protein-PII] uridylyltransferase, partial [Gammaproteobacteria bacterium]|nr:[protein-PII] uridylyltransferase [Gammaproteobacteria bacterium]HJN00236.1 [protein-PII] uridylyltransferase [Gammaproteobacteria bacterium]
MINTKFLDSKIEKDFSSYETKKKAISDLKKFIQKEAGVIDELVTKAPIKDILSKRCQLNDDIIRFIANQFFYENKEKLSIIAVGGYGRCELYPNSDTDLLILLDKNSKNNLKNNISKFLTFLWDIGIEASHSTRTIAECIKESKRDISVETSLLESRAIFGSKELFMDYEKKVLTKHSWESEKFFSAKIDEQTYRHNNFNNTAYNLEPNIKDGPGGLRDAHTIFWIAKRLGFTNIEDLKKDNILNDDQIKLLQESWDSISKIRYALHSLAKRAEDRLLFDYQRILANDFGYKDSDHLMAVEVFMQDYYKAAKTISRFNEICLQIFDQKINSKRFVAKKNIDDNFHIRNKLIGLRKGKDFKDNPSLLLEIFLHFQENNILGIESETINHILENLNLINNQFRSDPNNKRLFIKILKASEGVTHELKRMNLYGVLGLYLPVFGQIEGRMQFDLFHTLTVDEHTLNVVSNIRRLALKRFNHEYPEDSKKMQSLESQEILYLAGLFHDIAKGRGGDHSILGAKDAEDFCISHGMTRYQSKLVSWLVENHLIFSLTAQKKDIHDPLVIKELIEIIGDEERLEYLFLLTVCDVRATNPNLWNSWKERLFKDL